MPLRQLVTNTWGIELQNLENMLTYTRNTNRQQQIEDRNEKSGS